MAQGNARKFSAIVGSATAVGGAFVFQRLLGKNNAARITEDANLKSKTTRSCFDSAINESRILLNKLQKDTGCPGLSVAVSVNGETVWKEGFGFSDIENRVKCRPETIMKIASISKPITMTIAAKEWEKGNFDWDADVHRYVPYWPEKQWTGDKVVITPRHLSSHFGGVRDYKRIKSLQSNKGASSTAADDFDYEEYYITKKYKDVEQSVGMFQNDPLISKPGTEFHYTTHGFTLLAAALEGAAKKSFKELMEGLLRDLGLSSTYIDDPETIRYNTARQYVKTKDGVLQNAPFTETSFKIAGAGLLSTSTDLVKFGNILLHSFQQRSDPLGYLKPTTVDTLWTPVANSTVSWHPRGQYGMGWQIVKGERTYVGHTGSTVGASSVLLISVDEKATKDKDSTKGTVVAILGNLQGIGLGNIAVEIADKFLKYM